MRRKGRHTPMNTFTLNNDTLQLTFDRDSGALVGLAAPRTGWQILNRPQLGLSFRLLVPIRKAGDWHSASQRNNPVFGEKHKLASLDVAADQPQRHARVGRRHLGARRPARHHPGADGDPHRPAGRLRPVGRQPLRLHRRERVLPVPGRRAAPAPGGLVQDLPLPVRDGPGVAAVADVPEPARLLRRGLPHPVRRRQPCVGRAVLAVHPVARRAPGAVRRRERTEPGAGGLALRTAPRLRQLDQRARAGRPVDRRPGRAHPLRRRARALHPARRKTRPDAGGDRGLRGRLAGRRRHLQERGATPG